MKVSDQVVALTSPQDRRRHADEVRRHPDVIQPTSERRLMAGCSKCATCARYGPNPVLHGLDSA